ERQVDIAADRVEAGALHHRAVRHAVVANVLAGDAGVEADAARRCPDVSERRLLVIDRAVAGGEVATGLNVLTEGVVRALHDVDHAADRVAAVLDRAGAADHFHAIDRSDRELIEEAVRPGEERAVVEANTVPEIEDAVANLPANDRRSLR